jgi:hypothetical protein
MKSAAATALVVLCLYFTVGHAQTRPRQPEQDSPYTLRVDVIERSTQAVNYRHRSGSTTIDFRGTSLQPGARGEAKVESKQGYTEIEVEFDDMIPASRYGREYLTYVMWAVTPQGRSRNLGEVVLNGTKSKLDVTTELQSFGLIVTAEPYFAVTQPTDRVVLENVVRPGTAGKVEVISAQYELQTKDHLAFATLPSDRRPTIIDTSLPLDLQQARHAVRIAQWSGADRYAPEVMLNTLDQLNKAEEYFVRKAGNKSVSMLARDVVQNAEDARLIAVKRKQEDELTAVRRPSTVRKR